MLSERLVAAMADGLRWAGELRKDWKAEAQCCEWMDVCMHTRLSVIKENNNTLAQALGIKGGIPTCEQLEEEEDDDEDGPG
jgi:hypothetical protein